MAQRFVRCQLCGLPHPADASLCPVHQQPIVPAGRAAAPTAADTEPTATLEEVTDTEPTRPRMSLHETAPFALTRKSRPAPPPVPKPNAPTDASPLLGQLIDGRYRVNSVIATGGMGVVYDATQIALGRKVAIKAMHRRLAGDKLAFARFQHEATVVGRFGHPNIVDVYDMGTLEHGEPYLVMEKLDGETLTQRLTRERPLNLPLAVDVTSQVLSALMATHAKGIIHRDLKPDNVFMARREGLSALVKVLDFGISKAITDSPDSLKLTRAGFVMGTPAYMAPEQCRGERNLDARTDLYALGMILYELTTGRLPWAARSVPALLMEIQHTTPAAPRTLRPELPSDLDAFILRALARERNGRFSDASAMLRALRTLEPVRDSHESLSLPPATQPSQSSQSSQSSQGPRGATDTGSQAVQIFARNSRK